MMPRSQRLRRTTTLTFKGIAATTGEQVFIPEGYSVDVLFAAGDAVAAGAAAYTGSFLDSTGYEKVAGGNHDGMHLYPIAGVDPNTGGLLAINHEAPDAQILFSGNYNPATASAEQKKIALSSVGVSVIEVGLVNGKWAVKKDSAFNKRYTGNTVYNVSGPAAGAVGATVVGTLNNCASGRTPWGTYLTCEETTDNYLDPTQPERGYGWVVEIDPQGTFAATKRTALGRFDHENTDYMLDADNTMAVYMGDDSTPGCVYKFVPTAKYDPTNRAANRNLLDSGTLYAAKFNADGSGQWIELTQGKNGLVAGAQDPGNFTQSATAPARVTVDFNSQSDVLLNTKAAARVAGATLMDRPEWVTVGPDRRIYFTFTNNGCACPDRRRQPACDQPARSHHPLDGGRRHRQGDLLQVGAVPAGRGPALHRRQPEGQHQRRHLLQPGRDQGGSTRAPLGADRCGDGLRDHEYVRQQRDVPRGPGHQGLSPVPRGSERL